MGNSKQCRVLEIFFRALRGEDISVKKLADEYCVSAKSITRNINDLKAFLSEHRELVGNSELQYSYKDKCYRLSMDTFLSSKELFALVEVIIGARAFSRKELIEIVSKLKGFTTPYERKSLNELIRNEIHHYAEVKHDCESVEDNLWQLVNAIGKHKEISIEYYKMDRSLVVHRIIPLSVLFSDYYFYLIAFKAGSGQSPTYFRVDRINRITVHRKIVNDRSLTFDEGELKKKSLLMWPGKHRKITFEFSGPSVQAVLDKLPTAKILNRTDSYTYLIEAETFGEGIKMWLLSQGSWVKVIAPDDFRQEMKDEIEKMNKLYD